MILLANSYLAMALHAALFKRMVDFAKKYSPELPAEAQVMNWLNRFYNGDRTLQIAVELTPERDIIAHAVIDVQQYPAGIVIVVHQSQHNKPDIKLMDELFEYVKKLKTEINARGIVFYTEKHIKAYQERYGFKATRTVMFYSDETPSEKEEVN